jgi:hypothetical protein
MEKNRALRVTSTPLEASEDVLARVAELVAARVDGWVLYASGIEACVDGAVVAIGDGARGLPLAAEWSCDRDRSVHLRQRGDGWVWTEAVEEAGEGCIHEDRVRNNVPGLAKRPRMAYRTWWKPEAPDAHGVRPLAPAYSRFCGWKD